MIDRDDIDYFKLSMALMTIVTFVGTAYAVYLQHFYGYFDPTMMGLDGDFGIALAALCIIPSVLGAAMAIVWAFKYIFDCIFG